MLHTACHVLAGSTPEVHTTETLLAQRPMSTRRALPILLDRQRGLCARCGCRLIGHGWHPDGWVQLTPTDWVCQCLECTRSGDPEQGAAWTVAEGYAVAEVNHRVPRSAGGPNALSNYEATCGPCNLAHWREWRAAAR